MNTKIYFGSWNSFEDMQKDFTEYSYSGDDPQPPAVPADIEVLFASYGTGCYCGEAAVVFRKAGQLYEVHGSHCSCYGLEGMWKPEEATVESLRKTVTERVCGNYSDHCDEAKLAWGRIISELA
jgi:hypothetical protein